MDKLTLEYKIGVLKQIITRQELRIKTMHDNNRGVRNGSVSADIAHYMMIVERDKAELAELEQKLKEVTDG